MVLRIKNYSPAPMSDFAIQFNTNTYGLLPGQLNVPEIVSGGTHTVNLPMIKGGLIGEMDPSNLLQVAIKNNVGVYYFSTLLPAFIS